MKTAAPEPPPKTRGGLLEHPLFRVPEIASVISGYLSSGDDSADVFGAEGALHAIILFKLFLQTQTTMLVVTPTDREAGELAADLGALFDEAANDGETEADAPVAQFPYWGTLPYSELHRYKPCL